MLLYGLRKFLSVILVLILGPLVLGQIAASSVRALVKDSTVAKEALRESGLYNDAETALVEQLAEGFGGAEIEFTPAEVNSIVSGVLPATRLQRVIEPVIDELYVWFWTGTERPQLILDLTEVRTAFPGVIRPILTAKIEALPVCSAKQAAQLAASYQGGMAPCKSPDPSFNRRVVETVATDAELQTLIPAKLDLGDRLDQGDGADFWAETREELGGIRSLLTLIPFGWGLIGLLLVLLAVLNLDRRYTPFGWLAAPLLFSGLFMVIGGLIGPALADSIVQGSVTTSDLPPGAAFSAIQVVADKLFGTMRNLGFGTALIGLGCAITAVIGKRKGPHVADHRSGVA